MIFIVLDFLNTFFFEKPTTCLLREGEAKQFSFFFPKLFLPFSVCVCTHTQVHPTNKKTKCVVGGFQTGASAVNIITGSVCAFILHRLGNLIMEGGGSYEVTTTTTITTINAISCIGSARIGGAVLG